MTRSGEARMAELSTTCCIAGGIKPEHIGPRLAARP
jgi:hypothetical protein